MGVETLGARPDRQAAPEASARDWGTAFLASDRMIRLLGELEGEKTIGTDALRGKLGQIANEFGMAQLRLPCFKVSPKNKW
jgi:hypothetical protein